MGGLKVKMEALKKAHAEWEEQREAYDQKDCAEQSAVVDEMRAILLEAPDMKRADAMLADWGFEVEESDDCRGEELADARMS